MPYICILPLTCYGPLSFYFTGICDKMDIFSCDISNYLDQVAEEINDTLQESGQVVISELSKTFSFATDFLLEVLVIHYIN